MFSAELLKSLVYRRCAIILFEASAAKIWVPLKGKTKRNLQFLPEMMCYASRQDKNTFKKKNHYKTTILS